jgi:glycosyltransferase involved in cell wall biosynthesis
VRKLNTPDIKEDVWSSPKEKFATGCKGLSEALGSKPASTDRRIWADRNQARRARIDAVRAPRAISLPNAHRSAHPEIVLGAHDPPLRHCAARDEHPRSSAIDRRMKLIVQIPCFNEQETLGLALADLPGTLPRIDQIERLIINDGSTDETLRVAREHGVEHIVNFPNNRGLARAFIAGIEAALNAGADIIVNTDADNQYCADDIQKLIQPILDGEAEIVIGARSIGETEHFSAQKKLLQRLGSWVVRIASKTKVADAPSGFRAFSREAAVRLNVFSNYSYTLETIIQAGQKNLAVTSVPIRTNPRTRPSRLVKNTPTYVARSINTIVRIFMSYSPLRFFFALGSVPLLLGAILSARWLWLYFGGTTRAHVPSLVAAAVLLLAGFQLIIVGLMADLLSVNRKLLEDIQLRMRRLGLKQRDPDSF